MFTDQIPSVHADLYSAAGNRSLSSVDAVAIDDRFYRFDSVGWTRLDSALLTPDLAALRPITRVALPPVASGLGAPGHRIPDRRYRSGVFAGRARPP